MIISDDVITSRSNPFVKWAASLSEKKGRNEAESFIAEGVKLTLEALSAGLPITHIIVNESVSESVTEKIKPYFPDDKYGATRIVYVSQGVFEKISTEKAPQGVISIIKYLDFFKYIDIIYKEEFFLGTDERAMILCSVRDPSNLGAVIRSAVAFGTEHIILSEDCADIYSPKTLRSAMGSLFRIKVTVVKSLPELISVLRSESRRVFAAELCDGARSLSDIDINHRDVVIIGNEGHGIPSDISSLCTDSVYIPICSKTESLNASVAAAIFMWEQGKV